MYHYIILIHVKLKEDLEYNIHYLALSYLIYGNQWASCSKLIVPI